MAVPVKFYLIYSFEEPEEMSTELHITTLKCICKQHSYTKFNKSVRTNISIELYIFPN